MFIINIKRICRISLMSAILCILSILSINIGTVPITLQTFGVFLCSFTLLPVDAFISITLYLLLGITGLPVFAGFRGGLDVIAGPTGGYLISFPLAAFLASYISNRSRNRIVFYITGILSLIIIYLVGIPYLSIMTGLSIKKALLIGAYPFIIPDIIKMIAAIELSIILNKRISSLHE